MSLIRWMFVKCTPCTTSFAASCAAFVPSAVATVSSSSSCVTVSAGIPFFSAAVFFVMLLLYAGIVPLS